MSIIKRFTLRLHDRNFKKLDFIADKNKRSINAQIDYIIEEFIDNYEKFNGKIDIKEASK